MSDRRMEILHRNITDCIRIVKTSFETNHFNFLTEGDVQCRLFLELNKIEELRRLERTLDNQMITPLHSEVTYFDETGAKLAKHIDISAISPNSTNVYSDRKSPVLSKNYEFGNSYFLIEIKLNRGNWSKNKTEAEWRKDLDKLSALKGRLDQLYSDAPVQCSYISIMFDKRGHFSEDEIRSLKDEYIGIELIYAKPS